MIRSQRFQQIQQIQTQIQRNTKHKYKYKYKIQGTSTWVRKSQRCRLESRRSKRVEEKLPGHNDHVVQNTYMLLGPIPVHQPIEKRKYTHIFNIYFQNYLQCEFTNNFNCIFFGNFFFFKLLYSLIYIWWWLCRTNFDLYNFYGRFVFSFVIVFVFAFVFVFVSTLVLLTTSIFVLTSVIQILYCNFRPNNTNKVFPKDSDLELCLVEERQRWNIFKTITQIWQHISTQIWSQI